MPACHPPQYSRVQTPNIIPGKVPRTTFDGAIPKEGVFTPENAHLSSRPLDVRQREAYEIDLLKPGEQLAILRPKELQKWWEARAMGRLATNPETVEEVRQSQEDWKAERLAERRARVHGVRSLFPSSAAWSKILRLNVLPLCSFQVNKDGEIVGQRIYLPNIVFRLIPNATHFIRPKQDRKANKHANQRNKPLAMEQYNPYIATFRVPASLNKIDIKGYLKAVYNLETTFVSTALMHKTRYQVGGRGEWKNGKSKDNYKRAVVGLTKPFYYPNDPLGMAPEARTAYEERLNAEFNVTDYRVAEVAMRRRQYDNVRNNIGLSERSAKIYPTKPDESLKCVPSSVICPAKRRSDLTWPRLLLRSLQALEAGSARREGPRASGAHYRCSRGAQGRERCASEGVVIRGRAPRRSLGSGGGRLAQQALDWMSRSDLATCSDSGLGSPSPGKPTPYVAFVARAQRPRSAAV